MARDAEHDTVTEIILRALASFPATLART